jgi:MFS family permease
MPLSPGRQETDAVNITRITPAEAARKSSRLFQGWLVDRFGPKLLITGLLSDLSWVLASYAYLLTMLYLTYGLIGGIGTGIVYVGVVGQAVGWFPSAGASPPAWE